MKSAISGQFVPGCSLMDCVFAVEECLDQWAVDLHSLRVNYCIPLRMNYSIHSYTELYVLMSYQY